MNYKTTHILLGCLLLPLFSAAQWSTATLSVGRYELASCKAGNKLLFAGGATWIPQANSKRVDIYDLVTETWSVDSLSEGRDEMSAASYGDLAFFVGSSGLDNLARIMDIYDASTGAWSKKTLPHAEYIKAITASDNKVFIGGNEYIDIYNIATGQWSSHPLSEPRNYMAAASVGNKVLFAGGYGSKTVDVYDISTDTWTTTNSLSEGRQGLVAVTLGDKAYFAGGVKTDYNVSKAVDIYDASTDTWSVETLSIGRGALGITTLNGKVFFAGGRGNNGSGYFNSIDILDTATNQWSTAQLSAGRHSLTAVSANGKAYFAGGNVSAGSSNLIDVYDGSMSATSQLPGPLVRVDFYPNPCHDQLNIQWFESMTVDHCDAAIYTLTGQLLTRTSLDKQPTQVIPVDQIPKGAYVLKLTTDQQSVSKMFVKE